MLRFFTTLSIFLLLCSSQKAFGQWKQTHVDRKENNHIIDIHFFNAQDGFVVFNDFIGYTTDGGKTFTENRIDYFGSNVNFNGYRVNLTLGFTPKGMYAKSRQEFFLYGHYSFNPAVLHSTDGGNTFTVVYHYDEFGFTQTFSNGFTDLTFPGNGSVGYAVEAKQLIKTTNGGRTWNVVKALSVDKVDKLYFFNESAGYLTTDKGIFEISNGGSTLQPLTLPVDSVNDVFFLSQNKGWFIGSSGERPSQLYHTADGGKTWQERQYNISGGAMKFITDSIGYMLDGGYNVLKTIDGGKFWEYTSRDNQYTYFFYGHNALFFIDENRGWAGGGHGFLENTINGGGSLKPIARFYTDTSLISTNLIKFQNLSKPGDVYKWYRNSAFFATTYDASYTTDRKTIDTFSLVVQKGVNYDTATIVLDTRDKPIFCRADFEFTVDTSSVQFTSVKNDPAVIHTWSFGDGTTSDNVAPQHKYQKGGVYIVTHKVYNPVDKCQDSLVKQVQIIRTQNCLIPYFTYVADSFFTNQIKFEVWFDSTEATMPSGHAATSRVFQYGDGQSGGFTHTFSNAGEYLTCLSVTNDFTGCVSKVCKPVSVKIEEGCNADFKIRTDAKGVFEFIGKPHNNNDSKTNLWIINDKDTIRCPE